MTNIFQDRDEAFRFGYAAFHDGFLNNFYNPEVSDEMWWKHREWQHGFDVAYLEAQNWWDSRNADTLRS